MATEPFLAAEPALADLAAQFEQWRRTRATAHERIPPALWEQAVVLTTMLPHSQVAKRLRLSPTDLKKQCVARQGSLVTEAAALHPGFVEVTSTGFETPVAPQIPDGVTQASRKVTLIYAPTPSLYQKLLTGR